MFRQLRFHRSITLSCSLATALLGCEPVSLSDEGAMFAGCSNVLRGNTMFKWRRWATPSDSQSTTQPLPIVENGKEEEQPIPYDLINAQLRILDRSSALTIIDAGAHHGHTTEQYLENFNRSRVIAIEPERENFARATARVSVFGSRVELVRAGLSDSVGTANLHRNDDDMNHSLLKPG